MNNIGAELTALSLPGYPYPFGPSFRPYRPYPYGYGGVFFGAEQAPPPQRTGLTAELAPIVAPATGGIMVRKHLDDRQVLHVEICVDGKCHSTSMDLAPAIAMLMGKLKAWHDQMHAPQPPPETVVSTVQAAVGAAEDMIVGALVARHIDTVAAGFIGDIAGAASSALRGVAGGVRGITGGLRSTLRKLKGPIGTAAAIAAASGASAIPGVGPIAAPLAGKLANDLVAAAAGDSKAQQAVAQASQQAATDPATAAALDQATKAVANSTAAYHVQDTAKKAARGDSAAQQEIVKVADDAQKGDPAAKAVADLIANAMKSEWGAKLWEQVTGRGPATVSGQWHDVIGAWHEVIGAAIDDVRSRARQVAGESNANVVGVVRTARGTWRSRHFRDADLADDWLGRVTHEPSSYTYAAVFDKGDIMWPHPLNEKIGTAREVLTPAPSIRRGIATTSG